MLPPKVRAAFRLALRRPDLVAGEVDDEIAFHLQERIDALVERGWSLHDATDEAKRRFGDATTERDALFAAARHRERRLGMLERVDAIRTDLAVAVRQFRQSPSFAFGTVAALALGIGANATMFSVLDRLLLRAPAQISAPEAVYTVRPRTAENMSLATVVALRDNLSPVASVAVQSFTTQLNVGRGSDAATARSVFVDGSYFRTLGAQPALGRLLSDDDARLPDGQLAAVIGFGFWQRQFGGDSTVIGREVSVASERVRVVGVAPEGFNGPGTRPLDLWLPLTLGGRLTFLGPRWATTAARWLFAVVRVSPGASRDLVASRAATIVRTAESRRVNADTAAMNIEMHSIIPYKEESLSPEARVASLLGAVSLLVLLIACSNAANLVLARTVRRQREIAIRMALGVSRSRLVAQVLTESILLSLLAGAAALLVATGGGALMRGVLLEGFVWDGSLVDLRTAGFIAAAAVLAGATTGLVPALSLLRRVDVAHTLGEGRQTGGPHRQHLLSALVVTQTVLSALLLIGTLLFVKSLTNIRGVPLGFDPERTAVVSLDSRTLRASDATADALFADLAARVAQLPGVSSAVVADGVPFDWHMRAPLRVPDRLDDSSRISVVNVSGATRSYFSTIGTRIVQGREFTDADDHATAERVIVVPTTVARTFWPAGDAIGHCLRLGADSMPCLRIIGVAEDTRESAIDDEGPPIPRVYVPLSQGRRAIVARVVLARVPAPTASTLARIRTVIQASDARAPTATVWTMQSRLAPEQRPWKLGATMFGVFGSLALVLAALGVYSVVAYSVTQRTREIGIRIALGAQTRHIFSLVGTQGAILGVVGVTIAVGGAAILSPLVQPLLFHESARSLPVYAAVALGMLFVAVAASVGPALRARRVNPMSVIRSE